jgi:tetratricopeptide (TPR) repeat protein
MPRLSYPLRSSICVALLNAALLVPCLGIGCGTNTPKTTPATKTTEALEPQSSQSPPNSQSSPKTEDFEEGLKKTSQLLAQNKTQEAWDAIKRLALVRPQDPELIYLSALVLAAKDDLPAAIQTIRRIPQDSPRAAPAAGQAAEWTVTLGKLPEAEAELLAIVKNYPTAVPAIRLLAKIYNAQGRRFEANRYLQRLIRLGDFTRLELLATVDPRDYFDDETVRNAFANAYPDHPYVAFAPIRTRLIRNGYEKNFEALKQIATEHPDLLEPWVWTATSLLETDRLSELQSWLSKPPTNAQKHPEYWYALGGLMLRNDQDQASARCFVEAIRLDRRHVAAYQGLADALIELQRIESAQRVRQFANDLIAINDYAQQISYAYGDPKLYDKIAGIYQNLGDDVAAFGWEALAVTLGHRPMTEALKEQKLALRKLPPTDPKVLDGLPWESWPLPSELAPGTLAANKTTDNPDPDNLPAAQTLTPLSGARGANAMGIIAMEDVAKELGIHSAYNNGAKSNRSWYTIEGIGGGVNALDFDKDGWPDLYFSEAEASPLDSNPEYKPKTLFRSIAGKQFLEVAKLAHAGDVGYGQGVGVSDFDQDGFPDLLVANLGVSRIYRNQGDGTFEVSLVPQDDSNSLWNSSIHAADLNGDSLPDLISASYVYGSESISRRCESNNSTRISCNPKMYPPGKNRILLSNGDGSWESAPDPLLESIRTGYTLGTLVTNLDQRHGNDVFFANDVSPNNLLLSEPASFPIATTGASTSDHLGRWDLIESAAASGVAVDSIGRAQACMGISCGDQNRDGLLDIIVTNFYNEVSTLYLQTLPGVFVDGTRRSKLGIATLDQLSFGSQLSDLDSDGWLDFIAVNGHIDDLRTENIPWHMPTQILKNQNGEFRWLQNPSPGPYFDGKWIGRGLQMLDFNVDGKPDLVATHLDRPAALLENRTASANHFVQWELVGTLSERDAIGAVLRIEADEEFWVTSLCDGEGFFGSNERLIHLGVGKKSKLTKVRCVWPSGNEEVIENLDADKRYRWVEGQGVHEVPIARTK